MTLVQGGKSMKESLSKKETPMIIGAGVIIGIIAVALVYFGNPANMGFCIACFLRDTTGALGFHSAAAVQYVRRLWDWFLVPASWPLQPKNSSQEAALHLSPVLSLECSL